MPVPWLLPPFIDAGSPASWCEQICLSCSLTANCGSSLFFSVRWRESFEKENRQQCLVVEVKPDETELLWVCFVCLRYTPHQKKKKILTLNSCPSLIGLFKSAVLLWVYLMGSKYCSLILTELTCYVSVIPGVLWNCILLLQPIKSVVS